VCDYKHGILWTRRKGEGLSATIPNRTYHFPLSATHLGYLADLLGITWRTCSKIRQATGWMSVALLSFHVVAECQSRGFNFPVEEIGHSSALIVSFLLSVMTAGLTLNRAQFL
jgi:hypothetical protein